MVTAWQKNNWRELKKTVGRFMAMVAIVALGVGFFMGLKSARPAMVNTCSLYLDDTGFFDLQLLSSIAFDQDAAEVFAALEGVSAAEASISADMMTASDDGSTVYKTHLLPQSVNQVHLTAGRMPQSPNECLADDLLFFPEDLGTTLTVIHQEDSIFSQDTYTVVGLCNSPLYLNLSRGTTSLGNGTIAGFLYLTQEGYDADYFTEIFLRLDADHKYFDPGYHDYLAELETPLTDLLETQGQTRLDTLLQDARKELDDGWDSYYEGKEELETAKADVAEELRNAEQELADAKKQLEDGQKELEDGEETLQRLRTNPYSFPELADARAQLDQGWQELEDGEAQYEDGLKQYNSMRAPMQLLISEAKIALGDANAALQEAHSAYQAAETAFQQAEAALQEQQAALYAPVQALEGSLAAAKNNLSAAEAQLQALAQSDASDMEIAAATLAVEAAREQVQIQQSAYDAAKAAYDAQAALLQSQLEEARGQLEEAKQTLDSAQSTVDSLTTTIQDAETQLADAETQLLEAKIQLIDGRKQLEEGEATLQSELANAIATAEAELADGRIQLADGQKQYEDGLKEYEEGKAEAEQEFADADKELAKAYRDLQQGELDVQRMADPSYYVLSPTTNAGYISFDNDTSIVDGIAKVFPLFFFLVAALVCSSTMTRMVEEQRTQNGTLKAMGYSNSRIMMRYAVYAGSAAVIGFGFGLLIGTFLFPYVIWVAYQMLYHFSNLHFVFHWGAACIALVAALASSVGAACLAAWSDLQLMPAQLMRPKTPKAGKRIFLEYITLLWNSLSFLAKVSLRNIFRYKKRLFMMILGTGGCLALLLAGLGLRDSIANVANDQFGLITLYDYAITFDDFQTKEEQQAFLETYEGDFDACAFAGTSAVEVTTKHGIKTVTVIASSNPAMDELVGLTWEGDDLGYPTGDGVYISHALAQDADLNIGDMISLKLESNDRIEVPITAIFTNYVSNYMFLTEEGYETWFGIAPEIQSAYASAASEDVYEVGAHLQGQEDILNVTVSADLEDMVANVMSSLNAIIILIVVFAMALAFVVGYNLININITERVREIATIKVLGFYQKETHDYVFRESILLTILGSAVGVPLGIWLHTFIMDAVRVDFVCFHIQIAPLSYAIGIAITLLTTVIVDKMLGKKIDQINMAESLKSVE